MIEIDPYFVELGALIIGSLFASFFTGWTCRRLWITFTRSMESICQ